jgi:hypothetical protein
MSNHVSEADWPYARSRDRIFDSNIKYMAFDSLRMCREGDPDLGLCALRHRAGAGEAFVMSLTFFWWRGV